MSVASLSRRDRRQRGMSAPVLTQLRPVTVDDLAPGQMMVPGQMIFTMQTLPVENADGPSAYFWSTHVWLPEELRSPTVDNAKTVMAYLRTLDPDARHMIDRIAAIARDPRSRRVARHHRMTERRYSSSEARKILRTLTG